MSVAHAPYILYWAQATHAQAVKFSYSCFLIGGGFTSSVIPAAAPIPACMTHSRSMASEFNCPRAHKKEHVTEWPKNHGKNCQESYK